MLPGKKYTPEDILTIVWRSKWFLLVPFAVISAGTAVWSRYLPDRYLSQATIMVVPQRVPESYVRSTVTTTIEDRLRAITEQIMSRTRLERVILELDLYPSASARPASCRTSSSGCRRTSRSRLAPARHSVSASSPTRPSSRARWPRRSPRSSSTRACASARTWPRARTSSWRRSWKTRGPACIEHEQPPRGVPDAVRRRSCRSSCEANLQVGVRTPSCRFSSCSQALNRNQERRILIGAQLADLESEGLVAATMPAPTVATAAEAMTAAQRLVQAGARAREPD